MAVAAVAYWIPLHGLHSLQKAKYREGYLPYPTLPYLALFAVTVLAKEMRNPPICLCLCLC
jgi:hypothetical protein